MQGVPFREDIMESGHSENPATARPVQTTSQALRTAVMPPEPQASATSGTASTTSTTISTASTQVSATVTPVTTSDASGVPLQSAGSVARVQIFCLVSGRFSRFV